MDLVDQRFRFLLASRAARSVALSFSAVAYPLYLSLIGFSYVNVGIMTFLVMLFTVFQSLLLGFLGDRIGFKSILIIGDVFPIISLLALALFHNGPLIYLSVIGGIGGGPGGMRGAFSTGTTAIVAKNWEEPSSRVVKLSLLTSTGALFSTAGGGMVISRSSLIPLFGSTGSYRILFLASSILMLASVLFLVFVAEREVHVQREKHQIISKKSRSHVMKVVIANSFNGAGIGIAMPILSLWFAAMFPYAGSTEIGVVFTISYLSMAVGSFISPRISFARNNPSKVGSYGRMLQGLLMVVVAFSPFFWIAGVIYIGRMFIAGFGVPSRTSINVGGLSSGDYGSGSSIQASAARIAQTTSGASGYLMDLSLPLPEIVGGTIQFFAGVIFMALFGRKK